jgi:magnesium-transporting ATPase (P-type)
MHMALCHTVIIDPKSGKFNSSSPDELALVQGAANLGYKFVSRDSENVISVRDQDQYQVLNVLEFSSARKRMSVVIRHLPTGKIQLLTKGADSVIEKLMAKGQ